MISEHHAPLISGYLHASLSPTHAVAAATLQSVTKRLRSCVGAGALVPLVTAMPRPLYQYQLQKCLQQMATALALPGDAAGRLQRDAVGVAGAEWMELERVGDDTTDVVKILRECEVVFFH